MISDDLSRGIKYYFSNSYKGASKGASWSASKGCKLCIFKYSDQRYIAKREL